MTQHLSVKQINKFISREMPPDELLLADDHLAGCNACMNKLRNASKANLSATQGTLFSDADDPHLTYEQISSLVNGTLDDVDQEIVDVHQRTCETCAAEIVDLRRLREALAADVGAVTNSPSAERDRWTDRVFASIYFRIAAPVAALLLLGSILWLTQGNPESPVVVVNDPSENISIPFNEQTNIQAIDSNTSIPSPRIVASLTDGASIIELDETGKVTGVPNLLFEQKVRSALTTQNVEIPADVRTLKSASGVWMGGPYKGTTLKLIGPMAKVIETQRPTFSWQGSSDGETYEVEVFDDDFNKVVSSPQLKATNWTPNESLRRGRVYRWKVKPNKNEEEVKSSSQPLPEGRFMILGDSALGQIELARRSAGNSHLVLGIAYANAGLLDEAQREFQQLVKSNPNSAVARKLLAKVKAAR